MITFATFEEAEATLQLFNAKNLKPGLYESDIGFIAITGIGPFAAFHTLQRLEFDEIINIGLAGSLREDLTLGSIHPIATCKKHLWHPRGIEAAQHSLASSCSTLHLNKEGLHLSTVDFPLHGNHHLFDCDLIDMEGYSVALLASIKQKPCKLYKLISDYCNKDTFSTIKTHLPIYSHNIALFLQNKKNT